MCRLWFSNFSSKYITSTLLFFLLFQTGFSFSPNDGRNRVESDHLIGSGQYLATLDISYPVLADNTRNHSVLPALVRSEGINQSENVPIIVGASPFFNSIPLTSINEGLDYFYSIRIDDEDGDVVNITAPTLPTWLTLTTNNEEAVTTFAGSGTRGDEDGVGTRASFRFPTGLAFGPDGDLYVAERNNHFIRRINQDGEVSTIGVNDPDDFTDTSGTFVAFILPVSVAVNPDGNIYVVDRFRHQITRLSQTGQVSTLAGTGDQGAVDGLGTEATFNNPNSIAIDSFGNAYVADLRNHLIRKITPDGFVSTFAGSLTPGFADGIGTAASFNSPSGVAVDNDDNVYVADASNNAIRKITPGGEVTTLAGSGIAGATDGTGTDASFFGPSGLDVDDIGNVYVADKSNHIIRKITPAAVVTTLAGNGTRGSDNGSNETSSFHFPTDVAVDSIGNIFVTDNFNLSIRKVSVRTAFLSGNTAGQVGDHDVIINADDGTGNTTTQSFTISVIDVIPPVFTSPSSALFQENSLDTVYTALATDDYAITYSLDDGDEDSDEHVFNIDRNTGVLTFIDAPDFENPIDADGNNEYLITVLASDGSNTSSQLVTIVVVDIDEIAPVIMASDITVGTDLAVCGAVIETYGITATDNAGEVTLNFDVSEGSQFSTGNTIVNITAEDESGNIATTSIIVTVNDTEAPAITLNGASEVTLDFGSVYTEEGATATDNCSATLAMTGTVNTSVVGVYTITYQATDASGNVSVITRTVNVVDNVLPVITASNITVSNDLGICGAIIPSFGAIVTDNAGEATLSFDVSEGSQFSIGNTIVNITAEDESGNIATTSITVTVNDTEVPTVALNGASVVTLDFGSAYTEEGATVTDNCSVTLSMTGTVNTTAVGVYTITYQATDASGNVSEEIIRTVNVVDNAPPVITASNITVNNDLGICGAIIPNFGATATDNAGEVTLNFDVSEGSQFSVGNTIVNITAEDENGNVATTSITVIVNDTEAPSIALNGASVITLDFGSVYTEEGATISDNCSAALSITGEVNTTAMGVYIITYQTTDASGNGSVIARTVNVLNDIAPEVEQIQVVGDPLGSSLSIAYEVVFSKEVENVSIDDFRITSVSGDAEGSVSQVSRDNGSSIIVELMDIRGNGVIRLDLIETTDIVSVSSGMSVGAFQGEVHNVDTKRPSVTIVSNTGESAVTASFGLEVRFSEPVTGFDRVDLNVSNGTVTEFEQIDDQDYRLIITPSVIGEVEVILPADRTLDFAGNSNTVSNGFKTNFTNPITDIVLSSSIISENQDPMTMIGVLQAIDEDVDDSFSYKLVSGFGDNDNLLFGIEGSSLLSTVSFDFEKQSVHTIRVEATDARGISFEKSFEIFVQNLLEAEIRVTGNLGIPITRVGQTFDFELQVHNDGDGALTVENVSYPEGFIGAEDSFIVLPSERKTMMVRFTPITERRYTGNINLSSSEWERAIEVTGEGRFPKSRFDMSSIRLFPIPATDVLNVDFSDAGVPEMSVDIVDVSGNRLLRRDGVSQESFRIDLSTFPNGLYIVQFSYAQSRVRRKIIVER